MIPSTFPEFCTPIYIPLCFYFIALRKTSEYSVTLIYIPLCFYFIGQRKTVHRSTLSIYIPLCFYFIRVGDLDGGLLIQFTFHYASTLSRLTRSFGIRYRYLHSTMLLLYRNTRQGSGLFCPIYIPLCFYFILQTVAVKAPGIENLHSTMLLLYQGGKRGGLVIWLLNLHSTMLLLYLFPEIEIDNDLLNLHSTMLLLYRNRYVHFASSSAFTFHYASTLSHLIPGHNSSDIHLHSTMLLLYL